MQVHDWISLMLGGAGLFLAAWRRFELILLRRGHGKHKSTGAK